MALSILEKESIAKRACVIIFSNEGNYGSVNKNDNGAVSIGKVQWHGSRALSLMKTIIAADNNVARSILGVSLYNEITAQSINWNKRILNQNEADRTSALLKTTHGQSMQDSLALSDVLGYVNKGISYGLSNAESLIYFADGVNQYGTNSSFWKNVCANALKKGGTLDAMYDATKALTSNYLSRRINVYNKLKNEFGGSTSIINEGVKAKSEKTTVKMIQKWCNDYAKTDIAVDGIYGPTSKKAMIQALQYCLNNDFKRQPSVIEDGIWGPDTSIACDYVSSNHNKNSNLAFIAQCLLYLNGYNPNGLDSSFGPGATKAAKLFQSEHNLTSDGSVGRLTFSRLVS